MLNRIRLLVDVMLTNEEVEEMQRDLLKQPLAYVRMVGKEKEMGGRFMGAQMVESAK